MNSAVEYESEIAMSSAVEHELKVVYEFRSSWIEIDNMVKVDIKG